MSKIYLHITLVLISVYIQPLFAQSQKDIRKTAQKEAKEFVRTGWIVDGEGSLEEFLYTHYLKTNAECLSFIGETVFGGSLEQAQEQAFEDAAVQLTMANTEKTVSSSVYMLDNNILGKRVIREDAQAHPTYLYQSLLKDTLYVGDGHSVTSVSLSNEGRAFLQQADKVLIKNFGIFRYRFGDFEYRAYYLVNKSAIVSLLAKAKQICSNSNN